MYNNKIKSLDSIDLADKTVVVRTDFDVPIIGDEIVNTSKIRSAVKTIEYLIKKNCKVVVLSHLGEPKGKEEDDLSLMAARFELGKLLNTPVKFAHIHACGNSIKFMEKGEVLVLENLKFHKEEYSTDTKTAKHFFQSIIELADVYINEAFGVHEELASVVLLPKFIKTKGIGFNVQKEIEKLTELKNIKDKPFVSVIGGKADEYKLKLIERMLNYSDYLLIGGTVAYQFLKSKKVSIGKSIYDSKFDKKIASIIAKAKKAKVQIILPVDHICAEERSENAKPVEVDTQQIPKGMYGLDVGPKTLVAFREIIESAKIIYWEGAMGNYEWENFNRGTEAVGEYIALSAPKEALKFANGNSVTHAMEILKIKAKRFTHVSLGDKVTAAFLADLPMPALDVLVK